MIRALGAALLLAFPFVAGCSSLGNLNKAVISGNSLQVLEYSRTTPQTKTATGHTVRTLDLALYIAANRGDLAMAKALVKNGADPRIPDVLEVAAQFDRVAIVEYLLAQGSDPHSPPAWGGNQTAFDTAVKSRRSEVVKLMAAHAVGASVSEPSGRRGNLDDAAYDRMRAAAGMTPEKRTVNSAIDTPARRGTERPNDFALVIGIEEYQSLPKADFGVRDAATVRKHFEAIGVPARNIIALEGAQATGSKMKSYLQQWLPRNVKPESTVFVYYSGHGAPDPESGDAYLVPWDGDPMFLATSAYPLKQFYAELSKLKAKRVIVALDACFSGSGGRSVLAKGARPLVSKVDEGVPESANLTVLAAASGSEITGSLDEQGHGIFTYHFLKGLSSGAKTPRALHDYLKPLVQDDARRQNREQSPTLAGSGADAPF